MTIIVNANANQANAIERNGGNVRHFRNTLKPTIGGVAVIVSNFCMEGKGSGESGNKKSLQKHSLQT